MTQQEFIDRTGLTPTAEEFATVHRIYMACATLDKDEFCRDYKKHGMSRIVAQLLDALIGEERKADAFFELSNRPQILATSIWQCSCLARLLLTTTPTLSMRR